MRILSDKTEEVVPPGKRWVRETVWGNTNAYVGRKFWKTLGTIHEVGTAEAVKEWLDGQD